MTTKTVFQTDHAGMLLGETMSDESPLEPGVWLIPARAVEAEPPSTWADDKWPRWNGGAWDLVTKPAPANDNDPLAALESQVVALQAQIAALRNNQGVV